MRRALLLTLGGLFLASTATADITPLRFAIHRKDKFEASKTIPALCDNPATTTVEVNYSPTADGLDCTQYTVTGPAPGGSQLYFVIGGAEAQGVGGTSFGIDYDGRTGAASGVDPQFNSWVVCTGGLDFPNDGGFGDFPAPKGGIRITWVVPDACGKEVVNSIVHAICGSLYVYAYSEDVVRLTPNNNLSSQIPELAVTDCSGTSTIELVELLAGVGLDASLVCGRAHLGGSGAQGYTPCGIVPTQPSTWGKIKTLYTTH